MNVHNRDLSFFLIPAAVIAAFSLLFVGVVATLNHHQPLTSSIETALTRPTTPELPKPVSGEVALR